MDQRVRPLRSLTKVGASVARGLRDDRPPRDAPLPRAPSATARRGVRPPAAAEGGAAQTAVPWREEERRAAGAAGTNAMMEGGRSVSAGCDQGGREWQRGGHLDDVVGMTIAARGEISPRTRLYF